MAAFVQGFEYDIFISYRQKDNKGDHWVTTFVHALQTELDATFKEDISIYFDANPHDGLLETHHVDKSLEGKLKCLIFIPVISQTYCDPGSFAWQHELCAFNKMAQEDQFGRDIRLGSGNVGSRILPVKIHALDADDKILLDKELGSELRAVDFIYKESGVNRPLRSSEENPHKNQNQTIYRNQVNKVANAVKELMVALKKFEGQYKGPGREGIGREEAVKKNEHKGEQRRARDWRYLAKLVVAIALAASMAAFIYLKFYYRPVEVSRSIAVLPFTNMSNDPSQDYFSDGITDEILDALTHIQGLKVSSRTSSFQFKGKNPDPREVGKSLGVNTILEGSVQKEGDRFRITAQLINVEDNFHIWSEKYEVKYTKPGDIFAIQDKIAAAVSEKFSLTLRGQDNAGIRRTSTESKEAHELYLKGEYFWNLRKLKESEKYFKEAIALDSSYAEAYAGLGETYIMFPFFHGTGSPREFMPQAQVAAETALRLDSTLSVPYATLAFKSARFDWNKKRAKSYMLKALQMNPAYPPAHYFYGQYLYDYENDTAKSLLEVRKAVELDPLGIISNFNLAMEFRALKRYPEAVLSFRQAIELSNQTPNAWLYLGYTYFAMGQMDKARESIEAAAKLGMDRALAAMVYFYVKDGEREKAEALYNDLIKRSMSRYVCASSLATAASFLGKKDLAHDLLKQAIADRDPWVFGRLFGLVNSVRLPNDLLSDHRNVELLEDLNRAHSY